MLLDITLNTRRARARTLHEATESWRAAHVDAMAAYVLEDIVRQSLALPSGLREVWNAVVTAGETDAIQDFEQVGKAIFSVFDATLEALNVVHGAAEEFAAETGHVIIGLDSLKGAIGEARQLVAAYRRTWPSDSDPWPLANQQRIDASLEEYRRGDYLTMEEAIREAAMRYPANGT
jgi:hypothetical protein